MPDSSPPPAPSPATTPAPTGEWCPRCGNNKLVFPVGGHARFANVRSCRCCGLMFAVTPSEEARKASGLTEREELECNMLDFEEPSGPASDAPAPPRTERDRNVYRWALEIQQTARAARATWRNPSMTPECRDDALDQIMDRLGAEGEKLHDALMSPQPTGLTEMVRVRGELRRVDEFDPPRTP